jgi:hypothetical protein
VIEDMNEVAYHLLRAQYVSLTLQYPNGAGGGAGAGQGAGAGASRAGANVSMS